MDKNSIKKSALEWGGDFFGVADLEAFRSYETLPAGLLDPFSRAVSIGVALSRRMFETLVDGPHVHYAHHYTTATALLDQVALRISGTLQKNGFQALPLPASQTLDWARGLGALSHKAVARMAGLGWQGKSLLLVNPNVGPRLRVVTILTDAPLEADQPLPNGCGKCLECATACPAGAIKGTPFGQGYQTRAEAWDIAACTRQLESFNVRPGLKDHFICGLCIKPCPIGRIDKEYDWAGHSRVAEGVIMTEQELYPRCAMCGIEKKACRFEEGHGPEFCPTTTREKELNVALEKYREPETMKFALMAARQEAECYSRRDEQPFVMRPVKTRVEEIIEFAQKMNYRKLGVAFCMGLFHEARTFVQILEKHGFEVVSAGCKIGAVPKEFLGLQDQEKVRAGTWETMCNPIMQAEICNEEGTDFNILVGLCVGHDSLFLKNAKALTTVLVVKDRA
ncbi:MAG: DUF1847 domain-containing protein, partial [Deltaproteobacteria bacterium]|nr:DUF1847 domain-containing protein [Deltaproteobacteria bacterium]